MIKIGGANYAVFKIEYHLVSEVFCPLNGLHLIKSLLNHICMVMGYSNTVARCVSTWKVHMCQ